MTDSNQVDRGKRRFLIAATTVAGGVATAAAAVPFVVSMLPSQRALAIGAPVEVDIGKIEPGAKLDLEWQGKVVWIVNRTKEMLQLLPKLNDKLADPDSESSEQPDYCKNLTRSLKPQYFIAIGLCTHLGCSPTYRKEVRAPDLGADWPGGFFCPCHGSRFDLAGRVFKNVPAPTNLRIPPHRYLSDNKILIGEDNKGA
ncbi:MAG TPA: ubiquinol-cytochrome c reductase iron-sulfur subunit [Burkholderiales bacterium]|nr:ubiquinol-cytochrome c reductase iron-sulfur subunit [Burkholderiales bacterium]